MRFLLVIVVLIFPYGLTGWGFFAHQKINHIAVFSLPPEMISFYKHHIRYITDKAVNPDKRRYILKEEAARHYIDLDVYGDSALYKMPRYWQDAVNEFTEDTLRSYGIVPWHISMVKYQLTQAFLNRDVDRILRYSADIGHYIGDAHVPLHTTQNYNGQLTNQYGIHGFWESRLPELFFEDFDLFVGKAEYLSRPQEAAWQAVESAHLALDSVFLLEQQLTERFSEDKKYSFEERGGTTVRVYSFAFSKAYHELLQGMVERQMKRSIKAVADFWYTAWVDGGQPDLHQLLDKPYEEEALKSDTPAADVVNHESGQLVTE